MRKDSSAALKLYEAIEFQYDVADVRVPYARWLAEQGRTADAITQASLPAETYERLRAAPSLAKVRTLLHELQPSPVS